MRLGENIKPSQVVLAPLGLLFEHALKRFRRECISGVVKRYGDSAAIRMEIVLVSTRLAVNGKTIPEQGCKISLAVRLLRRL